MIHEFFIRFFFGGRGFLGPFGVFGIYCINFGVFYNDNSLIIACEYIAVESE